MVFYAFFFILSFQLAAAAAYCVHSCYEWIDDTMEFCDEMESFRFIEVKNEFDQIKVFIRILCGVIDIGLWLTSELLCLVFDVFFSLC